MAGNTGNAIVTVKVDKTNPTIVATAKKADGSAYTFGDVSSQTVTVHYACADGGSLIASCTSDQVFSNDGTFSTSGAALDNAGRSASSGAIQVRIDKASSFPILSALVTNKTGASNARAWTVTILNSGLVPAANVLLSSFTLAQTGGPACTPIIAGQFPTAVAPSIAAAGTAAAGTANAVVTIDFIGCSPVARFTTSATFSSNAGSATGTMTLFNQLR